MANEQLYILTLWHLTRLRTGLVPSSSSSSSSRALGRYVLRVAEEQLHDTL